MINWKTHRRLLVSALVPLGCLVAWLVFLMATKKIHGSEFAYFAHFLTDPLSAGLDFLTGLMIFAYIISRHMGHTHPRHRGFFAAGTAVAGLVMNGIYIRMLRETKHFYKVNGTLTFLTSLIVFYCIYRLVVLLPLHTRKWVTPLLALLLLGAGLLQVRALYAIAALPCGGPPHLWAELIGHCS